MPWICTHSPRRVPTSVAQVEGRRRADGTGGAIGDIGYLSVGQALMGARRPSAYNRGSCIMQPPDMEGILQQLNPPGEAKLAHGVRFVDLDGLVAQVQPSGDFLVTVALRHETQHFGLAVRERRRRPARPLSLPGRKRRGEVMH